MHKKGKPLLINLFGAPGAGKSTGAAYVYALLKMAGINAELITEFAKDLTWEHNSKALANQVYVLGNQYHRITRCEDEVDVIITDSPLLLSDLYCKDEQIANTLSQLTYNAFAKYDSLNYYIKRSKKYNPNGRNQNEEESDEIAGRCLTLLNNWDLDYKTVSGDIHGYENIFKDAFGYLMSKRLSTINKSKEED